MPKFSVLKAQLGIKIRPKESQRMISNSMCCEMTFKIWINCVSMRKSCGRKVNLIHKLKSRNYLKKIYRRIREKMNKPS